MSNSSLVSKIFSGAIAFGAALTQNQTNGVSLWGTFDAPQPPLFLTNNPLPDGKPWGARTAKNSNPYHDSPNTGVTRRYDFTVRRGKASPDGYEKDVMLINDQFPGPLIEANWGDWIEVKLTNGISQPEEGTALHWHGLLQTATPWFDGVPSVQQCPVAPGSSFTYRFKADLYGSSWYHSHYSSQYAGGLLGPMIIHGPTHVNYDIDLGPVILSDYFHKEYFDLVETQVGTNQSEWLQYSDNNLINGKMFYDCSLVTDGTPCKSNAGISKFKFKRGKVHRLRLMNTGAAGNQMFSIDGHAMTVIANDFVPLEPYNTTVVTLGVGQRTDVLVRATGKPDDAVWMRSNISTICNLPSQPNALAAIYYDEADTDKKPQSTAWPYVDTGRCNNDDLAITKPYYPITPAAEPEYTQEVVIDQHINATGHLEWRMNAVAFHGNYNKPLLLEVQQGRVSFPADPQWNVYNMGANRTVRFVVNNNSTIMHPMHYHGHNMYVLHEGEGFWDGESVTNPRNPQRRDVQLLRPGGHIVFQIDSDNPGVWPFHCHVAWHLSQGLYMNVIERPDDVNQMNIPDIMSQTCRDWETYSSNNIVDQIDSGL